MNKVLYFLLAFLESFPAIFGIRSPLEQPPYQVVASLGDSIEIRSYGPLEAVETVATGDEDAFGRLFRYITGANAGSRLIAMTAPVTQIGGPLARVGGGSASNGPMTMRFFLPKAVATAPPPKDPRVRIVMVPAKTIAVIRFSGPLTSDNFRTHREELRAALTKTNRQAEGEPYFLGYDPPFTIPALRRNEIAIDLKP